MKTNQHKQPEQLPSINVTALERVQGGGKTTKDMDGRDSGEQWWRSKLS